MGRGAPSPDVFGRPDEARYLPHPRLSCVRRPPYISRLRIACESMSIRLTATMITTTIAEVRV